MKEVSLASRYQPTIMKREATGRLGRGDTFPGHFSATITHGNSPNTIGRFLGNEKGKIPIMNRGDAVYKIRCECGIGYLGQTGRSLNTGNVPKGKFDPTKTSKTWKKSRLLRFTPSKLSTSWHLKTPNQ